MGAYRAYWVYLFFFNGKCRLQKMHLQVTLNYALNLEMKKGGKSPLNSL